MAAALFRRRAVPAGHLRRFFRLAVGRVKRETPRCAPKMTAVRQSAFGDRDLTWRDATRRRNRETNRIVRAFQVQRPFLRASIFVDFSLRFVIRFRFLLSVYPPLPAPPTTMPALAHHRLRRSHFIASLWSSFRNYFRLGFFSLLCFVFFSRPPL